MGLEFTYDIAEEIVQHGYPPAEVFQTRKDELHVPINMKYQSHLKKYLHTSRTITYEKLRKGLMYHTRYNFGKTSENLMNLLRYARYQLHQKKSFEDMLDSIVDEYKIQGKHKYSITLMVRLFVSKGLHLLKKTIDDEYNFGRMQVVQQTQTSLVEGLDQGGESIQKHSQNGVQLTMTSLLDETDDAL